MIFNKQILSDTLTPENIFITEIPGPNGATDPIPVPGDIEIVYDPDNDRVARGALFRAERRLKFDTEYRIVIGEVEGFAGQTLTPRVRTFKTFTPSVIGSADVALARDLSLLGDDRLAVASGDLPDPEADQHGISLLDVTDPARPFVLSHTPVVDHTWGVWAMENARVEGLVTGPAVLAATGGTQAYSQLRVYRVTGAGRDGLEYIENKVLSVPGSLAGQPAPPNIPNQSGVPMDVYLYGDTGAYVPMVGLGLMGVNLADINANPGRYLHYTPVTVDAVRDTLLMGDMHRLFLLSPDLSRELAVLDIPAQQVCGIGGFPVPNSQRRPDLAFAAGKDRRLYIADITDPQSPGIVSAIELPEPLRSVRIDPYRHLACVSSWNAVYLVDVSNPYEGTELIDTDGDGADDRILGTVKNLPGAGQVVLGADGIGYVADTRHHQVHTFQMSPLGLISGGPDDLLVFADEPRVEVYLYLTGGGSGDAGDTGKNVTVSWSVQGPAGGVLQETVQTSADGIFLNTFTAGRTAGDEFYLKAEITASEDVRYPVGRSAVVGPFTVLPGAAADLTLAASEPAYPADGAGKVSVRLFAKDAYGNTVADGTAVNWNLTGGGAIAARETVLVGGKAAALVRAGTFPEPQTLTAFVGSAQTAIVLDLVPVDITVTASQTAVAAESGSCTLDISVSSPTGSNIPDGTPIHFFTTLGKVVGEATVKSGKATAEFHSGELIGTAKIAAHIGNSYGRIDIDIVPPSGLHIGFDPPLIIGDKTEAGVVEGEALDGVVPVAYWTSSEMTVSGPPGETVAVSLEHNREPIAWYFMDGVEGNAADDIYHDHNAVTSGVTLDSARYVTGGGSYFFNGDAVMTIPEDPGLHVSRPAFQADIRLSGQTDAGTVIAKEGSWALQTVRNGDFFFAEFTVHTDQGSHTLTSSEPVAPGKWQRIGAAFTGNEMTLTVDDVETTLSVTGAIVYDIHPVLVGEGFAGNIDNLQIIDLARSPLVTFEGGAEEMEIVLDALGRASAPMHSTGALRTNSPNEYFVRAKANLKNISGDPAKGRLSVISAKLAWYMVNVTQGAVIGDVEGLSGAAGDIAASFVLYGDLRDIALIGPKLLFGKTDTSDKLVVIFAGVGILSTIYPPADPFVATFKVAAKLAKGSSLAPALAKIGEKILASRSAQAVRDNIDKCYPLLIRITTDLEYLNIIKNAFRKSTSGADEVVEWIEKLAWFERKYGDEGADLLKNTREKYAHCIRQVRSRSSGSCDFSVEHIQEALVEATHKIEAVLKKNGLPSLSSEAMEGVRTLVGYIGDAKKAEDIARILVKNADNPETKEIVVNNLFSWIEKLEKANVANGILNVEGFIKQLGESRKVGTSQVKRSKVIGQYHTVDYAINKVGLDEVKGFEQRIEVIMMDGKTYKRDMDIITTKDHYIECKNYAPKLPEYPEDYEKSLKKELRKQLKRTLNDRIVKRKSLATVRYVFRGQIPKYAQEALLEESKMVLEKARKSGLTIIGDFNIENFKTYGNHPL